MASKGNMEKRRRMMETVATSGLILICVALVAPFTNPENIGMLKLFKWIYAAGALVYVVARVVNVRNPQESPRLMRLRRMEFWAGMSFVAGAAFWFYQEAHLGQFAGILGIMRDTIMFTLAGAVIQIISSWMIVAQSKKESRSNR